MGETDDRAGVDIAVAAERWRAVPDVEARIERAVAAALAAAGRAAAPVSLLLSDDAALRRLNAEFRGRDTPTNVLSFPAAAPPGVAVPILGDIALAFETCAREAAEEGKPLGDHMTHLVVHGVLHLLGFDHETDAAAAAMEALETRVLAGLGIADPYRAEAAPQP